ncbi:MAG: hypothetical protein WC322_06920 [Candidatus Paceibacterota bacterium]|jgi:hypothetical protein
MSYHPFSDEDGEEYGSFEVFQASDYPESALDEGWYWWACFPGCLPDGDPQGPYDSKEEAINNAQS